ncbi:MAG: methyltransferase domain-containing protein [Candidatus Gottesmanbacteria bacterium]
MNTVESPKLTPLFMRRMDGALPAKLADILPSIQTCTNGVSNPRIISLGAGTGKVEGALAYALPNAKVYAMDYQLQMIEEIGKQMLIPDGKHNLQAIRADINNPPIARHSADAVVASSVVHEILSFYDNYRLGKNTEQLFMNSALMLKTGGVFVLRDFVQPDLSEEQLLLTIGLAKQAGDANPKEFLQRFINTFKGMDVSDIQKQILKLEKEGKYTEGAQLYVSASDALEIVVHYSWARRFEDEVKERYAYLPLRSYQEYIRYCFKKAGVKTRVIKEYAYVQPEYPEYINGRLDLYHVNTGKSYSIPPFTGVIALQRI